MARPIFCDSMHDESVPYAYMVTDGETGDVVALCAPCFTDFAAGILRATEFYVIPPGIGTPDLWDKLVGELITPEPESDADAVEPTLSAQESRDRYIASQQMADLGDEPTAPPWPDTHNPADGESAEAHEDRVRTELAARPNAVPTSELAVPWPTDGEAETN